MELKHSGGFGLHSMKEVFKGLLLRPNISQLTFDNEKEELNEKAKCSQGNSLLWG